MSIDDILGLRADSLLLDTSSSGRLRASGGVFERAIVQLFVVGLDGRVVRAEWFDRDQIDEALARFDELTAESRPAPFPNAATRAVERMERSWVERDWPAVVAMSPPGLVLDDRRSVVGVSLSGQEFLVNLRLMFDMPASRWQLEPMATRGNSLALFGSRLSGEARGGGPVEFAHLSLVETDARGQYAALVLFDAEGMDAAYAELDRRFAAGGGAPHAVDSAAEPFANAASRTMRRFERAWRERDWAGVTATFVPTHQMDDRRPLMRVQLSGDEFLANERMLFEETASQWHGELLATRGERLALLRMRFTAARDGSGPMAVEMLDLVEVDAAGRRAALVVFDLDDLEAAYAELDRRYAAGEGARWVELIAHQQALARAATSGDDAALDRLLPADFSAFNRQRFGGTGERTSREQFIAFSHTLSDLDLRGKIRLDHLLRVSATAAVAATTWYGTRDGGEFEVLQCIVSSHDGRRLHSWEVFDLDRLDLALARYEELVAERVTPRIENAASRAVAQGNECLEAQDWAGFAAQFGPDFRHSDRRRMIRLELDRAQYLEFLRPFIMRQRTMFDLVATRGTRLALLHFQWVESDDSVGPSDNDFLMVVEVDDAGTSVAAVAFDSDSIDAAYVELDARYAAGEAAPYAKVWAEMQQRRSARATRDWEQVARLLPADLITEDHRALRWGTLRSRDEYLARVRALEELAPDVELRLEHVLELDERGSLCVARTVGSRDGGAFEIPVINVSVLGPNGLVRLQHFYDLEQLDEARACWESLRRSSSTRHIENLATQSLDRLTRAWALRDWSEVAATLAPGFRQLDRRPMMQLELDREQFLAFMREVYDMSSSRLESEVIATRGSRLALARVRFEGADDAIGPTEIESLAVIEVDERGVRSAMVRFDADALDAAYAELDARYAATDPQFGRLNTFTAAADARDWDAIAALLAPDFVMYDHRPLGWEPLQGGQAWIEAMRALVALAPDVRLRIDHFAGAGSAALIVSTWFGTRDGGAFEDPKIVVSEGDELGRFRRMDQYDLAQLGLARERFDSLRLGSPAAHVENAATRTMARIFTAIAARDWDGVIAALAPGYRSFDRRKLMQLELDWKAQLESLKAIAGVGSYRLEWEPFAIRGDRAALARGSFRGAEPASGPSEVEWLSVAEVNAAGALVATVMFDPEAPELANAELERRFASQRVAAPHDSLAALATPNLATAAMDRAHAAFVARDWAGLRRVWAAKATHEDWRSHMRVSIDVDRWLADVREVVRASPNARIERRLIGTAGERIAIERRIARAGSVDSEHGSYEIESLWLFETDANGRIVCAVLFDPGDEREAEREARTRWLAYDADAAVVMRPLFEAVDAHNDHDGARLRAVLADDIATHDHRLTGLGRLDGADPFIDSLETEWALTPDVRQSAQFHVAAERHGVVGLSRVTGTAPDGGRFEYQFANVAVVAGGRVTRLEFFEPEDLDRARARLAELRPDPLRIPPNAAARVGDRIQEADEARNWESVAALCAPTMVYEDRRRHALISGGSELFIANIREVGRREGRVVRTLLATAGDRISLHHLRWTGASADVGGFETENLSVLELDADGRIAAIVAFDADDRRGASTELQQRFVQGDSAPAMFAAAAEFLRALREHDLAGCRAALPDDFTFHDHRRAGAGLLHGADEYVAFLGALFEQSPDAFIEPLYYVAVESHGYLTVAHSFGTLADGGEFESLFVQLVTPSGGELFDLEDLELAHARFEELRPDPLRIPPNSATRAGDRLQQAMEASDWEGIVSLCAPTMVFDDRRRRTLLTGDRDMFVATIRVMLSHEGACGADVARDGGRPPLAHASALDRSDRRRSGLGGRDSVGSRARRRGSDRGNRLLRPGRAPRGERRAARPLRKGEGRCAVDRRACSRAPGPRSRGMPRRHT